MSCGLYSFQISCFCVNESKVDSGAEVHVCVCVCVWGEGGGRDDVYIRFYVCTYYI